MTTTILYMGRRSAKGGKLAHLFIPADLFSELQEAGKGAGAVEYAASWYLPKKDPRLQIGRDYTYADGSEFALDGDRRIAEINFSTLKPGRMITDNIADIWAAADRAARAVKDRDAQQKKLSETTSLDAPLERLRRAYRSVQPNQRQAYLIALINEITKP